MVPGHLWILRSGRGRNSSEESVALLADLAFTGCWPGLQGALGFSGPGTQRLPAFVPNSGAVRTIHGAGRLVGHA